MDQNVKYPDPRFCLTVQLFKDLYECRVDSPYLCHHSLSFGSRYFCRHPDRHQFCPSNSSMPPHFIERRSVPRT